MRSTEAETRALHHPATTLFVAGWLAYLGVLQWSVVRFRVSIVLVLTAVAAGLTWWLVRRLSVHPSPAGAASLLLGSVVLTWTVPLFSYLRGGWLIAALVVVSAVGIGAGTLLARPTPRRAGAAYLLAVTGQVALAAVAILGDRAPRIDVWVTLQQAADALGRGENFYAVTWTGSPGIQDAFTYLPWTAVLLAPARWVAGDVRWGLALWSVVLLVGVWHLARPDGRGPAAPPGPGRAARAALPAAMLVVAPGAITQADQAWTEPLLAAALVWWAVLVRRGHAWWAVLPLALACASKQHLVLLLPLFAVWRAFGPRRVVATGGLGVVLVAPWFLASPPDFVHDTVTLLAGFHPIRFANTWYLLFLNELGIGLPFWLTGLAVLGAVGAATLVVLRRQPSAAELLRWAALVLLVANLVNKQAFYNQYWLSAALVAASLAIPEEPTGPDPPASRTDETAAGADPPLVTEPGPSGTARPARSS